MKKIISLLLLPLAAFSQQPSWNMEGAVQYALQHNKNLQAADARVQYFRKLLPAAGDIGKTEVAMQYGQYNSYVKNDNNFSVTQAIPFPTNFGAKKQLGESQVKEATFLKANTSNELAYQVKEAYLQLLYLQAQRELLRHQDSLFTSFAKKADLRYRTGEGKMLEKTASDTRKQEVENLLRQNEADLKIFTARLKALTGMGDGEVLPVMQEEHLQELTIAPVFDSTRISQHPLLQYLQQQAVTADKQQKVYANAILPDITVGYFNQSLIGTPVNASGAPLATGGNRFQGFQVGLALPIWARPMRARVKAEEQQAHAAMLTFEQNSIQLQSQYTQAIQQYVKQTENLRYYEQSALPNAELILKQSQLAYGAGEIGYAEHFLNLEQVLSIRQGYLKSLLDNKIAVSYIHYLAGNQ
ncbi:Outer membrane protein TolC [Chitinophaga jiangningensis]|uniref:Outer membrane protein TolC n=1 Tax=Chitinophaga jiangningensis TaxID=1419482 RepID=A0A1M7AY88_9BACT|nr:TolC family protein [Chitinophaga jiangningensis]SHL47566.1 Outer membrane protein TolC [Chitinophaga jiangningensis]